MRIKPEEIYAMVGLKVGDRINVKGKKDNPFTVDEYDLKSARKFPYSIGLLTIDFEKVESKIWNIKDIKRGNKYYYIINGLEICEGIFSQFGNEKWLIENGVVFKKEKYAEKYLEKLIEFNENYKKECE